VSWQSCTVANLQQFESVNQAVCEWFRAGKMVDVKVRESAPSRIDAMKALQHHWYNELSRKTGKSAKYMNAYCKLVFGVPILRELDAAFKATYDQVIKPLSQKQKIRFMAPPMSMAVTSNFNVKQMHRYLNAIKAWADKKGYRLTTSNDLYLKAMGG
tara:strand:- start:131 stop:601 length:471 start_codon:yes stop_codon:yes gene_type:complete